VLRVNCGPARRWLILDHATGLKALVGAASRHAMA